MFSHTCDPTVESNRLARSKESREKGKEKKKKLGTVRLRRYLFLPSFMFKHDVLMYSSFYFEYDSTSPLRMIPPPSRIKID